MFLPLSSNITDPSGSKIVDKHSSVSVDAKLISSSNTQSPLRMQLTNEPGINANERLAEVFSCFSNFLSVFSKTFHRMMSLSETLFPKAYAFEITLSISLRSTE